MLDRFIKAQEKYFNIAEAELKNGRKESHWMWFIFPQIIGLGESETSVYYAIESIEEAKEYMKNEYLSKNYDSLCRILLRLEENNVEEIFGYIDSLKLHSSLTLFYSVTKKPLYKKVLNKFFNGKLDYNTSIILLRMEENNMNEDRYSLKDLNLTKEQEKFIVENDLLENIEESIRDNNLICIDFIDYKLILNNRNIVGYVKQNDFENIVVHKIKEAKKPQAILYLTGEHTLYTVNRVVDAIRSVFAEVNIIYGVGKGEENKVFALITD